jgi:shikimate dehydrogenase
MPRAAVLGHPIAHSKSPVLHRAAYQALGLSDWTYDAFDVDDADLPGFVAGLDGEWGGLSLTMPLKKVALDLVDHVEPLAKVVGAVNTVTFGPAGSVGSNTDVHGIVQAVREASGGQVFERATILGGGATAASSLAAVAELGVTSPRVYVRSMARSKELLEAAMRMGITLDLHKWPRDAAFLGGMADQLVISTLPSGAADPLAEVWSAPPPQNFGGPAPADGTTLGPGQSPGGDFRGDVLWSAHGGSGGSQPPSAGGFAGSQPPSPRNFGGTQPPSPRNVGEAEMSGAQRLSPMGGAAGGTTLGPGQSPDGDFRGDVWLGDGDFRRDGSGDGNAFEGKVLLDVAYAPWPSKLAQAWSAGGGRVASGLDMLLYQAAEQVRLMTGRVAPVDEMRKALGE